MRHILGALAFAGVITSVSAQTPAPEAPRPDAGAQRAAPGDLGMAIMSARVSETGALLDGAGAVSASRLGVGFYRVLFGRDITNCTTTATSNSFFLIPSVKNRGSSLNISWYSSNANTFADADFSLIVYCHR